MNIKYIGQRLFIPAEIAKEISNYSLPCIYKLRNGLIAFSPELYLNNTREFLDTYKVLKNGKIPVLSGVLKEGGINLTAGDSLNIELIRLPLTNKPEIRVSYVSKLRI